MSKRAILLAGGKGTRLHPYSIVLPKPLMPIGDFPILEVIVRQLASCGFDHITMAVNHQADIIMAFFKNGKKWGIHIDYSLEDIPLGTMGPIKLIQDLPEHFLVMNGDVLTDLDYGDFYDTHKLQNEMFTISSYFCEQLIDYGVLETKEKRLVGLREKPRVKYEVSMGVYMMSREVLDYIPNNRAFGFDNLMETLVTEEISPAVKNYAGYWLDIGRPDDYVKAINEFENMRVQLMGKCEQYA